MGRAAAGKKQTFDDSDDEEAPPPKKKAKADFRIEKGKTWKTCEDLQTGGKTRNLETRHGTCEVAAPADDDDEDDE